jgi:hypothetical protein
VLEDGDSDESVHEKFGLVSHPEPKEPADIRALVQANISNFKVLIFSKSYCPFCSKAKILFSIKNVQVKVIELDKLSYGARMQAELKGISG